MTKTLSGFKKFILRGNAVDLAVGIMFGAALGATVNSLVKDVLTPFIAGLARIPDFSGLTVSLRGNSINYGLFFNSLISFILISFAVYFFVVVPMNKLLDKAKEKDAPQDPTTKKCVECLSEIPLEAKRCSHCAQVVNN